MRPFLFGCVFCLGVLHALAQVQSPEEYLGYKIGTKFTPHWKIVEYFNYLAAKVPSKISLRSYGKTNEGRPLLLAFIGSAASIKNLENIRLNNLRLAGLSNDNIPPDPSLPGVLWLSYNVHGGETSSSEAAMLTLFSLTDDNDARVKAWLANTLIIIDPCLNPDGRDRYVSWYNSVVGPAYNPDPQSREHNQPWPGARTNHYYFDLNRDWAWQSQLETKQRMQVYNQWLPQVHVDFHEMGYESPYYFAPAAEPFHEVITNWQKEFQVMVGKNNAKYFDAKGWLYFTKIGYDLFYPSYGDTYPTYNGAIGMTFEQGGGGAAGLGVRTRDGDTLTLVDRVEHHFTTSLSTIEVCSANKEKLVGEYQKFFADAVANGVGETKTYLIRIDSLDWNKTTLLKNYLRNNSIKWGYAGTASTHNGYSYTEGRNVQVLVKPGDIILSAYQPKAALLKVLFEPVSKQAEVTNSPYDITAWSLPYAFGIEAFAIKEKMSAAPDESMPAIRPLAVEANVKSAYAYVLPWRDFTSAQVLAKLFQSDIRVRYAEQPFSVGEKSFPAGSLIVTRSANEKSGDRLYEILLTATKGIDNPYTRFLPVFTGFVDKGGDLGSSKVHILQQPKIALLSGEGTNSTSFGAIWQYFDQQLGYQVTVINASDASHMDLTRFNEIIFPAGTYRFLSEKGFSDQLRSWVSGGGKIIAMEQAVSQFARAGWGLKQKSDDDKKKDSNDENAEYKLLKRYENREKESLETESAGTIYKVQLDNSHPLAFGYKDQYYTLKTSDVVYEYLKDGGWNVGVLKKDNYVSGFVGVKAREELKDGLVFGVQEIGRGQVVYLTDDVLFRGFWENGKLLFANAIFMVE